MTNKIDLENFNKKRNKYCFGYVLFLFPLTLIAFGIRGGNSINIQTILYNSIALSVYRIIGSIIILISVNVIIELTIKLLKK